MRGSACDSVYFFYIYPPDGEGTIKHDPPHLYGAAGLLSSEMNRSRHEVRLTLA